MRLYFKRCLTCSSLFCLFSSALKALLSNFRFAAWLNPGVGVVMVWVGVQHDNSLFEDGGGSVVNCMLHESVL
jgi:hypothetical protein